MCLFVHFFLHLLGLCIDRDLIIWYVSWHISHSILWYIAIQYDKYCILEISTYIGKSVDKLQWNQFNQNIHSNLLERFSCIAHCPWIINALSPEIQWKYRANRTAQLPLQKHTVHHKAAPDKAGYVSRKRGTDGSFSLLWGPEVCAQHILYATYWTAAVLWSCLMSFRHFFLNAGLCYLTLL